MNHKIILPFNNEVRWELVIPLCSWDWFFHRVYVIESRIHYTYCDITFSLAYTLLSFYFALFPDTRPCCPMFSISCIIKIDLKQNKYCGPISKFKLTMFLLINNFKTWHYCFNSYFFIVLQRHYNNYSFELFLSSQTTLTWGQRRKNAHPLANSWLTFGSSLRCDLLVVSLKQIHTYHIKSEMSKC